MSFTLSTQAYEHIWLEVLWAYRAGLVLVPLPVLLLFLCAGGGLETGVCLQTGVEGQEVLQPEVQETHSSMCGSTLSGQVHCTTLQVKLTSMLALAIALCVLSTHTTETTLHTCSGAPNDLTLNVFETL